MKIKLTNILLMLMLCLNITGQNASMSKLSPSLRRIVRENNSNTATRATHANKNQNVLALVKCSRPEVLGKEGCRIVKQWGDIFATSIPFDKLMQLAQHSEIKRIETGGTCQVCVDTTATLLGVRDVWKGLENHTSLTGHGVVMGIQDIGFDLTHPTFYSRDMKEYRIKAFWDMLDPDTIESELYVGRDYTTREALLKKAHAVDGFKQTHGVHTAGIAAGSGYDSPYIGMAPDADLCFVANAVGSDKEFINEEDINKYSTTTDVLGFQYIFDYAEQVGKPCVISFSEGAHEDLYGDAQLLYEVLAQMTGPGRIIVASAGNSSANKTYLHKPQGLDSQSSFLYSNSEVGYYTLRHTNKTQIDLHFSNVNNPEIPLQTISHTTEEICLMEDSLLIDTLQIGEEQYLLLMASYPSCYNPDEWATELYLKTLNQKFLGAGYDQRIRLTLNGRDMDVECFASGGLFLDISSLPQYCKAEATHNINFPAASSSVIAVGGTAHRTGATNYKGAWKDYNMGDDGRRWAYSSVGPTMQGLIKPDVVAPACNIISAYSSFYIEQNPNASDVDWDVKHFDYDGRTYGWNCNSGTSMSAPVVGGIIALWLQLCPTLTPDDIMQVIAVTSRRYDTTLPYPNNEYGWGEIDALEGAKYIKTNYDCPDSINLLEIDNHCAEPELKNAFFDLYGRKWNNGNGKGLYLIKNKGGDFRIIAQ